MLDQSNRTIVCSVVFLDIVEYSKKSVAEQINLKQRFNTLLSEALQHVPVRERVILDTGDGAAISFLGSPEEALFVASSLRDAAASVSPGAPVLPVRIGINLGPVRLVKDINGQLNIIGDGINVAQRVMAFSQIGQILTSRSYYEVVSRLAEDYAPLFKFEGARTDKHVREHEVYAVGAGSRAVMAAASGNTAPGISDADTIMHPAMPSRSNLRVLICAPLIFALIVSGGVMLRLNKHASATQTEATLAPVAKPASTKPAAELKAERAMTSKLPASQAKTEQGARTAAGPVSVTLAILPWGEVFVDGKSRGVSPPLKTIEVRPGSHTVEIRNTSFPSHSERIDAKPGEQVHIRHKFQ